MFASTRSLCLSLSLVMLLTVAAGAAFEGTAEAGGYYREGGRYLRYPDRHLLINQPRVRRSHHRELAIEVPVEVLTPPRVVKLRDPYDTDGLVIAGAGLGGLVIRANHRTTIASTYRLHLGLAVGDAEFALRLNLAPRAISRDDEDGGEIKLSLFAPGASFNYRFLPMAYVHPVAGVGIEAIFVDPSEGSAATAFAATARVGLELAFPLARSALALGIDTTGHLPFARADSFPLDISSMLSFSAYLDYRF